MAFRREKITPSFDPIVVTLDCDPEGIQREGQYGIDYQYTLNDNAGIMWLPKAGRDALVLSGARQGDQIEICKSQRGRVGGYVVTRITASAFEHKVQQAVAPVAAARVDQAQPMTQTQAIAQQAAQAVQAVVAAVPALHPVAQRMAYSLRFGIDACVDAMDYAKAKGLALQFNEEDVRAIAATIYIQSSKEGR